MRYVITKCRDHDKVGDQLHPDDALGELINILEFELFGDKTPNEDGARPEGRVLLLAGSQVSDRRNAIELYADGETRFAFRIEE